tara:strand:- start:37 stop:423 length:387 start_codon:yes stop_codon:yes gene_type:complete
VNLIFWLNLWANLKSFFKSVKNFCVKYWELCVGAVLVAVGFFLGRRNDTSKIDKADAEALSESSNKQKEEALSLTKEHLENREELLEEYEKRLDDIDSKREEIIEDLSNNDEKLDNILKEKYNLKKGN